VLLDRFNVSLPGKWIAIALLIVKCVLEKLGV
jgi:hypothetical protein